MGRAWQRQERRPRHVCGCRQCRSRQDQSHPRIGVMPDGTSRFSIDGKIVAPLLGTSTFSKFHRAARDRDRQDSRGCSPATSAAASTTGSAPFSTLPKWSPASSSVVLGCIGLNVIQGLRLAGADMIIGVDITARSNGASVACIRHPKEVGGGLGRASCQHDKPRCRPDRRRVYVRLHPAMSASCGRPWRRATPGLGSVRHRAPAGPKSPTRPFQLVTGRSGRVRIEAAPAAPTCSKSSILHGWQDRNRSDDHAHDGARDHQTGGSSDAQGREHQECRGILSVGKLRSVQ